MTFLNLKNLDIYYKGAIKLRSNEDWKNKLQIIELIIPKLDEWVFYEATGAYFGGGHNWVDTKWMFEYLMGTEVAKTIGLAVFNDLYASFKREWDVHKSKGGNGYEWSLIRDGLFEELKRHIIRQLIQWMPFNNVEALLKALNEWEREVLTDRKLKAMEEDFK